MCDLGQWLQATGKQVVAASLGALGNTYKSLSEYQKAIEHYMEALTISHEIGD